MTKLNTNLKPTNFMPTKSETLSPHPKIFRYPRIISLSIALLGYVAIPVFAAEPRPIWLTSACYQLRLSVSDKISAENNFVARYVVKAAGGEIYAAEKLAITSDPESSVVIFPDSFKEKKTGLQAYADCFDGQRYTWEIYANDALIDGGILEFGRKKHH